MTAMHSAKARAAWRGRCPWIALALLAAGAQAFGAEAAAPVTAVYKAKEISFHYRAPRTLLACHELQQRIAHILVAVGARDDIDVKLRNCDGFMMSDDDSMDPMGRRDGMDTWGDDRWGSSSSSRFGRTGDRRDPSISVRVQLMMPVEVTPEILKEIDKDKSRRELVSRVTGNAAAAFNDPVVFEARRQEVTLSQRTVRLRPEDCQLLEQMAVQVFRRLDVKVVRRNTTCGPGEQSRIPPQLVAEALLPTGSLLPMPDPEQQKQSGSGAAEETAEEAAEKQTETVAEPAPPQ